MLVSTSSLLNLFDQNSQNSFVVRAFDFEKEVPFGV